MSDQVKTLLKRIDNLCIPILRLGGEKSVIKPKDLEKNYNKGPLSELAFDLLSCLNDTKRHLEHQNRQLIDVERQLKEKQNRINELEVGNPKQTMMDILKEVKHNGEKIAEIKANLDEKSDRIANEASRVSSYAEILQKSVDKKNDQSQCLQPGKFAKRMVSEIKACDRKKNLVLYDVPADVDSAKNLHYDGHIDKILAELGFQDFKPNNIEVLYKPAFIFDSEVGAKKNAFSV